eukprot:3433636-Alexandrium_andersonii.AAC.1
MTGNGMHILVMCAIWSFLLAATRINISTEGEGAEGAVKHLRKRPAAEMSDPCDGDGEDLLPDGETD